jgi:hypothetical protein
MVGMVAHYFIANVYIDNARTCHGYKKTDYIKEKSTFKNYNDIVWLSDSLVLHDYMDQKNLKELM